MQSDSEHRQGRKCLGSPMLAPPSQGKLGRLIALLASACALSASCVSADNADGPAQTSQPFASGELFDGVVYGLQVKPDPAMRIHVLKLDLDRTRLEVTPGDRTLGREFVAQTPSEYLTRSGLQAVVNGGYFTPFEGGSRGGEDYYPHSGEAVDVSGASIANEIEASPVEPDEDERVNAIICIEGAAVEIRDGQACAPGTDHAMAAGPRLLARGDRRSFDDFGLSYASNRHPRTAFGLSEDRRTGWLVVVDGRQDGVSDGASLIELTTIFAELGASDAINLDGGGSTAMVVQRGSGAHVLNSPIHTGIPGRERPSANHLGVRAAELQGDVP